MAARGSSCAALDGQGTGTAGNAAAVGETGSASVTPMISRFSSARIRRGAESRGQVVNVHRPPRRSMTSKRRRCAGALLKACPAQMRVGGSMVSAATRDVAACASVSGGSTRSATAGGGGGSHSGRRRAGMAVETGTASASPSQPVEDFAGQPTR